MRAKRLNGRADGIGTRVEFRHVLVPGTLVPGISLDGKANPFGKPLRSLRRPDKPDKQMDASLRTDSRSPSLPEDLQKPITAASDRFL